jgi:nanoRNase/pAp phosphatase (c-di-AMP/oligoRNAs hydrolase)
VTDKLTLQKVLEKHHGERHIVLLPKNPNPDVIAAAFAHRLISSAFDISVSLLYSGRIRPRQNVALVKLLGIEFMQFTLELDFSTFDGAVLLSDRDEVAEEALQELEQSSIPVVASFANNEKESDFIINLNLEPRSRALSSLYTLLLQDEPVELNKSRKEHVAAATALFFGILTETDYFVLATEADFRAASHLSRYRDAELLEHIMSQDRSKHSMELIRRSLGERLTVESYSIAGVGYLTSEGMDAISQAADFLLTEDNIHTAIVYGIMRMDDKGEVLAGSMRTSRLTIYPDEFLQDVFGEAYQPCIEPTELQEGSFTIPVGFLSGEQSQAYLDRKWLVYDTQVKHKILQKIGIKQTSELIGLESIEK